MYTSKISRSQDKFLNTQLGDITILYFLPVTQKVKYFEIRQQNNINYKFKITLL